MTDDPIDSIHNHHERSVFALIADTAPRYPHLANNRELLADVACVALNRLPPRYIRHEVDFSFYLSDKERNETEKALAEAVKFAFEFVQARVAMRART